MDEIELKKKYINILIENITQTAVTNIMEQRMLLPIFKYISNLTFRMLQHTSSEVTVRLNYNKFKNRMRNIGN